MTVDLKTTRTRFDEFVASHSHPNAFACCTAHAAAEQIPALLAEIGRLRLSLARLRYAEAVANGWTVVEMHDGNWSLADVKQYLNAAEDAR
jgi:hypothetical protein